MNRDTPQPSLFKTLPRLDDAPRSVTRPHPGFRLAVSLGLGTLAAVITHFLPQAITLDGVSIGDVGPPLVGLRLALDGLSPYEMVLRSGPLALYPFTTMILLFPFLALPTAAVAPVFSGGASAVLAWALQEGGQRWRLMVFLSVPFLMTLYSVQWSPLFLAALLMPSLLPVAVAKPQLGIALLVAGRWSRWSILTSVGLLGLSVALRPTWLLEWYQSGIVNHYDPRIPLLIGPGFVLAATALFARSSRARLLLAMAVIPQRYFYDQLMLFYVPRSLRQMLTLLVTSWAGAGWCIYSGVWTPLSAIQVEKVWVAIIWTLYLPALAMFCLEWWMTANRPSSSE